MNFPKANWQLAFHFPTIGKSIESVQSAVVEPIWEVHEEQFIGLYRIAVQLTFSEQQSDVPLAENIIAIEAIDLLEQQGYFEYAMPFEGIGVIETMKVHDVTWQTNDQQLLLQWKSDISFQPPVQAAEEKPPVHVEAAVEQEEPRPIVKRQAPPNEQVVSQEPVTTKSSPIFLNDLVEQYSIWRSSDFRPQQQADNNE